MRPGPLRRAQRPWPPYPIRPSLGRVMAPGTRLELSAPVPLMRFGNKGREQKRREQTRCLTGRSGAAWQAEDTVGLRSSQLPQAIKPFTASAFLSPVHHLDRESRDATHAHDLRYCAARVLGFFKFTANTVSRSAYAPTALPCSLCSSRDGRKHASNRVHPTGKALAAARDAHPSLEIAI